MGWAADSARCAGWPCFAAQPWSEGSLHARGDDVSVPRKYFLNLMYERHSNIRCTPILLATTGCMTDGTSALARQAAVRCPVQHNSGIHVNTCFCSAVSRSLLSEYPTLGSNAECDIDPGQLLRVIEERERTLFSIVLGLMDKFKEGLRSCN